MVHGLGLAVPIEIRFFFGALVIAGILIGVGYGLAGNRPRVSAKPLLTERERAARGIIERLLPHARVHAQVSMGALLQPARRFSGKNDWRVRGAYAAKIVDFVIEDRRSGAILALVEVDDHSHDFARDRVRDRMTASAGYLTIRIPAGRLTQADIAARLQPLQLIRPNARPRD